MFEKLTEKLDGFLAMGVPFYDCMVMKDGKCVYRHANGYTDYGYGLGQRCPQDDRKHDFGWGGAAGAYYAVDRANQITVYMGTHIIGYADFQNIRSQILPIIREEL